MIVNAFAIPGRHDTTLATALEAIPGALAIGGRGLDLGIDFTSGTRTVANSAMMAR
jgi:hypothetical protein